MLIDRFLVEALKFLGQDLRNSVYSCSSILEVNVAKCLLQDVVSVRLPEWSGIHYGERSVGRTGAIVWHQCPSTLWLRERNARLYKKCAFAASAQPILVVKVSPTCQRLPKKSLQAPNRHSTSHVAISQAPIPIITQWPSTTVQNESYEMALSPTPTRSQNNVQIYWLHCTRHGSDRHHCFPVLPPIY